MRNTVEKTKNKIDQLAKELPARVEDARRAITHRSDEARRFTRKNPGMVMLGAFALGVILARLVRHV